MSYSYFDNGLDCKNASSKPSSFLENLEWRRAVKHFGSENVEVSSIVKAIINAPSSFGLQPYKVIAVSDNELKQKIRPVAYDQAQITECSNLFVFCARNDIQERAEEYLKSTDAEGMRDMLMGFIQYLPDKTGWAMRQAYIALGFALAACAELKIPSCPMEGFDSSAVSNILGLSDNLVPCVMLAVGSKAEDDGVWPRFRFPETNLIDERK
jgi:nitroreductase / dihydropteridine reductase